MRNAANVLLSKCAWAADGGCLCMSNKVKFSGLSVPECSATTCYGLSLYFVADG